MISCVPYRNKIELKNLQRNFLSLNKCIYVKVDNGKRNYANGIFCKSISYTFFCCYTCILFGLG